jgi:pimeloyl-ACP methyl ester carboxylesterase
MDRIPTLIMLLPMTLFSAAVFTTGLPDGSPPQEISPCHISEDTMQTVRSKDGTTIAFKKSGTGPPLVLIHGGTADHTRWDPIVPPLEKEFTVYAVDRRGRGRSVDTGGYSLAREFEDVAAVVDAIGEPVNLLGHSLGGYISLEASLLTENIDRLILYEPATPGVPGIMPPETAEKMKLLLDHGDRDGVISTFMAEVALVPPKELEILRSVPAWQGRVAAAHTILRELEELENSPPFDPDRFNRLTVDTLLLLGGDSPHEYGDFIKAIDAALPNGRLVILPGQQHVAMNTAPELFVSEVLKFLVRQRKTEH